VEELLRECGSLALKRYGYSELKKITRSFKEELGDNFLLTWLAVQTGETITSLLASVLTWIIFCL
jgi:hypothetical protein